MARYNTEFAKPKAFFMTQHLSAWVVTDSTLSPNMDRYQVALCINRTVADAVAHSLNTGDTSCPTS